MLHRLKINDLNVLDKTLRVLEEGELLYIPLIQFMVLVAMP